jgi:hypothetical protein
MLCWITGTGIVTVAGVAAGVGVGVGVGVAIGVVVGLGVGVAVDVDPLPDPPHKGKGDPADATPPLRTAPASATPPAARNCRLVANPGRMVLMLRLGIFQKCDDERHGFARCHAPR